jgi:hypothetical protein
MNLINRQQKLSSQLFEQTANDISCNIKQPTASDSTLKKQMTAIFPSNFVRGKQVNMRAKKVTPLDRSISMLNARK